MRQRHSRRVRVTPARSRAAADVERFGELLRRLVRRFAYQKPAGDAAASWVRGGLSGVGWEGFGVYESFLGGEDDHLVLGLGAEPAHYGVDSSSEMTVGDAEPGRGGLLVGGGDQVGEDLAVAVGESVDGGVFGGVHCAVSLSAGSKALRVPRSVKTVSRCVAESGSLPPQS